MAIFNTLREIMLLRTHQVVYYNSKNILILRFFIKGVVGILPTLIFIFAWVGFVSNF